MTGNESTNLVVRVAGWGGESGILVTMIGAVPVLLLGSRLPEDIAVAVLLAAYGAMFGHYLARRLPLVGVAGPEHRNLLRFAPPAATLAGFIVMRVAMGAADTESLTAVHGVLFGGVTGLVLGVALLRLPLRSLQGAPLPANILVPAALALAGAAMGIVAGFIMSVALGWLFAMPVWMLGVGGAVGFFLAPPRAAN